jgi:hypothetical protein
VLVAIEMGYGHLRAAAPLAERLAQPMLQADRAPLAGPDEQRLWGRARRMYEFTTRASQLPWLGGPLRAAVESLTHIPPLHPRRDLSAPTRGVRALEAFRGRGLGRGMVDALRASGEALLTTFFAPAIIADRAGLERVFCVVTDSDVNRVWAPLDPARTRIRYLAPSERVVRRLAAYGVPPERITLTGFPLPHELVGGRDRAALEHNLRARLVRLDPERRFRASHARDIAHHLGELPRDEERRPPLVTFAVGGAGAQSGLPRAFLPGFRPLVERGRARLALIAGVRPEVAAELDAAVRAAGVRDVEIVHEPDHARYFARMNELLARTDVLWTKPSELSFFAALGLPLVCAPPVGVHERYNQRWIIHAGAGFEQGDARWAAEWIEDFIADGALAAAAWAGYRRLPALGTYEILDALT